MNLEETLKTLPPPIKETSLAKEVTSRQSAKTLPLLVVLDDDPTGTQTCHGINVLTVWDHDTLVKEFETCTSGFFILTNSRALITQEARELIRTICQAVRTAAQSVGKDFEIVLRGDSTLRGHFPDEPEVAEEVIGAADAWILAPFFRQGGRLTINDVHYVASPDGTLIPAAQTPFAKDATFGYKNSNLIEYVLEKSKGSIPREHVHSISLDDLRVGGPSVVAKRLLGFPKGSVVIVNSVVDTDMELLVQGLLEGNILLSIVSLMILIFPSPNTWQKVHLPDRCSICIYSSRYTTDTTSDGSGFEYRHIPFKSRWADYSWFICPQNNQSTQISCRRSGRETCHDNSGR